MVKAVLFDADGVVTVSKKPFSRRFAQEHNIDPDALEPFFKGEFREATVGKADLKELILKHNDIWQWQGDAQELLDLWFKSENNIDPEILELISQLRAQKMPVYLATNQEKYRAKYIKEVMFPNVFDGFFISCEIGFTKNRPEFWQVVLAKLAAGLPGITSDQIVFFDDSQDSIDVALKAGINAYLYENIDQAKDALGDI